MLRKTNNLRRIYFASFAFLTFLLGVQVFAHVSGGTVTSAFGVDYWLLVLISLVPLLIFSSSGLTTKSSLPRVIIAAWLALFFWWGFAGLFSYAYPIAFAPWIGYIVYTLMIGIPLVVIAFKRIASLGFIKLMVCSGFLMVAAYCIFGLLYNYHWDRMYDRSGAGMFSYPAGRNLIDYIRGWLTLPDWIFPRLLTYAGLGYLLARRKGLIQGICISLIVALVDSVIYWLVFIPGGDEFEVPSFLHTLEFGLPKILVALMIEVAILGLIAALGALSTRVSLPPITKRTRQRRVVRRITPRTELG